MYVCMCVSYILTYIHSYHSLELSSFCQRQLGGHIANIKGLICACVCVCVCACVRVRAHECVCECVTRVYMFCECVRECVYLCVCVFSSRFARAWLLALYLFLFE